MFDNIQFEYPYLLALILPFIFCSFFCKEKSASFYFVHLKIFNETNSNSNALLQLSKYIAIFLAIISLASPVKIFDTKIIKKDGINIVLSLDTSGSMQQRGFNQNNIHQNRWEVVNGVVSDFMEKRANDNIGLVVFGTSVLTASPLSFDKDSQKEIIKYINIGIVGEKTALLDSLATSINILKEKKAKSNIIILLTDGVDTASSIPIQIVSKLAIKYNIKIYTIGIGESNTQLLNYISNETNGKSYIANSKDDLINVYEDINKLEKSEIDDNKIVLKEYLFFYPLFLSIMFLIFYIFIKNKD